MSAGGISMLRCVDGYSRLTNCRMSGCRIPSLRACQWILTASVMLRLSQLGWGTQAFYDLHVYIAEGHAFQMGNNIYGPLVGTQSYRTYPPFAVMLHAPGRRPGTPGSSGVVLPDSRSHPAVYERVVHVRLCRSAAAIKVTPGIFIVYLFATRRVRQGLVASATLAATILISTAADPRASRRYWTSYLFDTHRVGRVENAVNQTVRGMLVRIDRTRIVPASQLLLVAAVAILDLLVVHRLGSRPPSVSFGHSPDGRFHT